MYFETNFIKQQKETGKFFRCTGIILFEDMSVDNNSNKVEKISQTRSYQVISFPFEFLFNGV